MTQTPHDQLAKQYLEEFLAPFGRVERQYEVPGEAKYVDVWFIPENAVGNSSTRTSTEMGILGQMTQGMCLLEPYRNAPTRLEIRAALMKLLWVQDDEQRKAKHTQQLLSEEMVPRLWILAATVSEPLLQETNSVIQADWPQGIYFMADLLKTAIVAIDRLPETQETLWLRILGRGKTQEQAIREVLALPASQTRRNQILRLLASWKVRMDMGELADFIEQEEIMALSEAFLAWEQETKGTAQQEGRQEGRQEEKIAIALNLLRKHIPLDTIADVTGLTISQLQHLQTEPK